MDIYSKPQNSKRYFVYGAADPSKCQPLHGETAGWFTTCDENGTKGCDPATWVLVSEDVIPLLIFEVSEKAWVEMPVIEKTGEPATAEYSASCLLNELVDNTVGLSFEPTINERNLAWHPGLKKWV